MKVITNPMNVRFLDLSVTDQRTRSKLHETLDRVMDHGYLVMGPEIENLEKEVASICHRKYCIGVGSGSEALFLSLRALDVGKGDEVITTPLSWIAKVHVPHQAK